MRSQKPEHAVVTLLGQCFTTPKCQSFHNSSRTVQGYRTSAQTQRQHVNAQRRGYQTHTEGLNISSSTLSNGYPSKSPVARFQPHQPKHAKQQNKSSPSHAIQNNDATGIAVLGGGITGLATAHYLAKELPNAKITIFEGSERMGGWLRSQRYDVNGGKILFEQGPRTLRPSATASGFTTLELIQDLKLENQLLIATKDSDAARNRFIYYPDHLVKMPSPGKHMLNMASIFQVAWSLRVEPVFQGLVYGICTWPFRAPRPKDLQDESVGSFLERNLGGPNVGDNMVSAVLHGIYAGDIQRLSIKSLMPKIWYLEGLPESVRNGRVMRGGALMEYRDAKLHNEIFQKIQPSLTRFLSSASVYTFKDGIGTLSGTLEKSLRGNPNVEFKLNSQIKSLEYDNKDDAVKITTASNLPNSGGKYKKVISTISGRNLSTLTSEALPSLASIYSVTVMVVNLYYTNPDILPQRGFGYLIPRSISLDQNPERALGVVFDSDAIKGQDTVPGTKVTVMLGGHWWDSFDSYPDQDEGTAMAMAVLKRHLGVHDEPALVKVALQKDCIPQYTVGHDARMKKAHSELMVAFKGKVAVAGNSYAGVGLNDCIKSAREVVMGFKEDDDLTGLEQFTVPRHWVDTVPSPINS
ncbi:hypothetical protein G7Y89_g6602 [Cudoniella acicularis]|uniref:Protoporphyrinogen oxidase n=1 Tax=Cudoniella acicularis TaxID=354080 RepID=A0A8H4RLX7_9HELO|nr:hypothetical protein G7Y89_g6602 [Cudoniella acicularis]